MMFLRADVVSAANAMWSQFNYGDRDGPRDWTPDQRVMYESTCQLAWTMHRGAVYDLPTPTHWPTDHPPVILWSWIRDAAHKRAKSEISA